MLASTEEQIGLAVEWLRLMIETLGAVVIATGLVIAIAGLVRHYAGAREPGFQAIRLGFARYLMLALEFQLAADILTTTIAPDWDQIGKLAAIAVIRTALNYFLSKEMQEGRRGSAGQAMPDGGGQ